VVAGRLPASFFLIFFFFFFFFFFFLLGVRFSGIDFAPHPGPFLFKTVVDPDVFLFAD